jgi:tryprostatin B 6-hydroxylase
MNQITGQEIMSHTTICFLGFIAGVFSHWGYFIRGEHHLLVPAYLFSALIIPIIIYVLLMSWLRMDSQMAISLTATLVGSFCTSLWTSIIIYRACFHRLRNFDGPPLAKISKFYHVYQCLKQSNFRYMEKLHLQYGPIVRIGKS